jgi:hypothetical protein
MLHLDGNVDVYTTECNMMLKYNRRYNVWWKIMCIFYNNFSYFFVFYINE